MFVAIASDHTGNHLKEELNGWLEEEGHRVNDLGVLDSSPADHTDLAEELGLSLRRGEGERGILIAGSGVGASMAANRLPWLRAGVCHDPLSARQGVEEDDMNVLVLGARVVQPLLARQLAAAFLQSAFGGEERHLQRLRKMAALCERYGSGSSSLERMIHDQPD